MTDKFKNAGIAKFAIEPNEMRGSSSISGQNDVGTSGDRPHPLTRPPAGYELIRCTAGFGGYPDDTEVMLQDAGVVEARSWGDALGAVLVAVYLATKSLIRLCIVVNISADAKVGDVVALATSPETGRWHHQPLPSEFAPLAHSAQAYHSSNRGGQATDGGTDIDRPHGAFEDVETAVITLPIEEIEASPDKRPTAENLDRWRSATPILPSRGAWHIAEANVILPWAAEKSVEAGTRTDSYGGDASKTLNVATSNRHVAIICVLSCAHCAEPVLTIETIGGTEHTLTFYRRNEKSAWAQDPVPTSIEAELASKRKFLMSFVAAATKFMAVKEPGAVSDVLG